MATCRINKPSQSFSFHHSRLPPSQKNTLCLDQRHPHHGVAICAQGSLFDLRERSEIGAIALAAGAAGVGDPVRLNVLGIFFFNNARHGSLRNGNNKAKEVSDERFVSRPAMRIL